MAARRPVVFLPGGVTPVAASYAPLLAVVGDEIDPLLKELEVYAADEPPAGYSIAMEVDGLRRAVDAAGLATFHLVGFSGGGAVSLSFAARYPERLRSLAMFDARVEAEGPRFVAAHMTPDARELGLTVALPEEFVMASPAGFEPATRCLEGSRSVH